MPFPAPPADDLGTLDFAGDVPGRVLDSDLTAALGDILWGVVDQYGVQVWLANLTGWWDPAPVTGGVEQRVEDDGGWPAPSWSAPRVIQATLRLRGSSWAHLNQTIADIGSSIPRRALATFYVSDHGDVRQAQVRQEGDVLVTRAGAGADVSISLIAPDPRRYSADLVTLSTGLPTTVGGLNLGGTGLTLPLSVGATTTAGSINAVNAGNESTRPTFTIVGPSPAGSLIHRQTGRILTFLEAVAAGHSLVIDVDRRRALLDGTSPQVILGTWFDYAPGLNEVSFFANDYDSAARLISVHRSAWR